MSNYFIDTTFTPETHPVIAIDLDGTIWEDNFPNVGKVYPYAIETINRMVEIGYEVIVWTSRGGTDLLESIKHLDKLGLDSRVSFNTHAKWFTDRYPVQSPKIGAHVYIDDKAYGSPFFGNKKPNWYLLAKNFCGYNCHPLPPIKNK